MTLIMNVSEIKNLFCIANSSFPFLKGQMRAITLTGLSYWLGWCGVLSSSSPQQRVSASRTAFEAVHEQHHARHGW